MRIGTTNSDTHWFPGPFMGYIIEDGVAAGPITGVAGASGPYGGIGVATRPVTVVEGALIAA